MQPMFLFILDKEKEQEDSINHSESSAFQKKIMCVSPFHFHYTEQQRKKIVINIHDICHLIQRSCTQ